MGNTNEKRLLPSICMMCSGSLDARDLTQGLLMLAGDPEAQLFGLKKHGTRP